MTDGVNTGLGLVIEQLEGTVKLLRAEVERLKKREESLAAGLGHAKLRADESMREVAELKSRRVPPFYQDVAQRLEKALAERDALKTEEAALEAVNDMLREENAELRQQLKRSPADGI